MLRGVNVFIIGVPTNYLNISAIFGFSRYTITWIIYESPSFYSCVDLDPLFSLFVSFEDSGTCIIVRVTNRTAACGFFQTYTTVLSLVLSDVLPYYAGFTPIFVRISLFCWLEVHVPLGLKILFQ